MLFVSGKSGLDELYRKWMRANGTVCEAKPKKKKKTETICKAIAEAHTQSGVGFHNLWNCSGWGVCDILAAV